MVIEVADTTLVIDREVKAPLYAKAGISEYWIINLIDNQIETFHSPQVGVYQHTSVYGMNDEVKTQFNKSIVVKVGSCLDF